MTGFTGSAGNLLVTKQDARLFVDSRYYLQAEQQIAGSGILLMKEGLPGVPSLSQFILETLPGQTLGLDGRCVSLDQAKAWAKAVTVVDVDLISPLWQDRPPLFTGEAFRLADHLAGRTAQDKLRDLRSQLKAPGLRPCSSPTDGLRLAAEHPGPGYPPYPGGAHVRIGGGGKPVPVYGG